MSILGKGQDVSQLGNSADWESQNLTVYANHVELGGNDDSLFEENAYTTIYLKNNEKMESISTNKVIETAIQNEIKRIDGTKMKLMNVSNYSIIANKNVEKLFKRQTVIFTVGEAFNITKYQNGDQQVYISRSTIPGEINEKIGNTAMSEELLEQLNILEEAKNLTSYDLVNIKVINNITNSSIRFMSSSRIVYPISLKANYDKSWGMHKIYAKGLVNGMYSDIDVKQKNNQLFALLKYTPIANKNKLICHTNNSDNLSLTYSVLKNYVNVGNLKPLIITTSHSWKESLWVLFLSILELTKAFSNGFDKYQIKGTDGRSGVDPDATIGGIKIGLLSGTSSNDAADAISGRIDDWKSSNPAQVDTKEFKTFKVIVNMLSEFIQCDLALGNGLNQANKIDQIFYFDLKTAIVRGIANDPRTPIDVQLKSKFYDIDTSNGNLTLKDNFKELSTYQVLDLDGDVNLAEMDEKIDIVNLPSKQGDKNPASEAISKYYVYIPVDNQDKLKDLYGETTTTNVSGQTDDRVWEHTYEVSYGFKEIYDDPTSSTSINMVRSIADSNLKGDFLHMFIQDIINGVRSGPYSLSQSDTILGQLRSNEKLQYINSIPTVGNLRVTKIEYSHKSTGSSALTGGTDYSTYYNITISADYTVVFSGPITRSIYSKVLDKQKHLDLVKNHFSSKTRVELDLDYGYINTNDVISNLSQLALKGLYGNDFSVKIRGITQKNMENILEAYRREGTIISEQQIISSFKNPLSAIITAAVLQKHQDLFDGPFITTTTINNLEFLSKYDETQTTTKVNF